MKVYDAGSIRNVAVVGHGGCGKTQLVSTLLFAAGAVNRIGRVDDGTTVTDFDEEEIARKHTLSSSLAYAEWQKTKINFIDTPGFANFLTDARSALRVVEAAVVVVDAVAGVEVQTEKLWAEAAALGLPRIVVLNRLDRDRASLDRALESLRRDCAREIVPVQLPLGEEKAFIGVVDLVKMKAQTFARRRQDDRGGHPGGAGRHRAARPRAADRDGRRGRRAADGNLLRRRHAHPGAAGRRPAHGDDGRQAVSAAVHVGAACHRHAAAARCDRELRAVAGRARLPHARQGRRRDRRQGLRHGAVRGVRLEDDRRSLRRPHHDAAHRLRHAEVRHHRQQRDARSARASRPPARAAGQDADARAGAEGGRPRRGGQAEGHPHQRRPGRQEHADPHRADHVPGAGPRRTRSSRRAAATKTRSAPRCIASRKRTRASSTRAIRRPTSCCSPARGSCTSRSRSRS